VSCDHHDPAYPQYQFQSTCFCFSPASEDDEKIQHCLILPFSSINLFLTSQLGDDEKVQFSSSTSIPFLQFSRTTCFSTSPGGDDETVQFVSILSGNNLVLTSPGGDDVESTVHCSSSVSISYNQLASYQPRCDDENV
jgi:hypothetical protein